MPPHATAGRPNRYAERQRNRPAVDSGPQQWGVDGRAYRRFCEGFDANPVPLAVIRPNIRSVECLLVRVYGASTCAATLSDGGGTGVADLLPTSDQFVQRD